MKPIHGIHRPKDLPKDAQDDSPVPCEFKLGDRVIFTNDNGVKFEKTVRGFAPRPEEYPCGRFIFIFTDAWWMPVHPKTLKLVSRSSAQGELTRRFTRRFSAGETPS